MNSGMESDNKKRLKRAHRAAIVSTSSQETSTSPTRESCLWNPQPVIKNIIHRSARVFANKIAALRSDMYYLFVILLWGSPTASRGALGCML